LPPDRDAVEPPDDLATDVPAGPPRLVGATEFTGELRADNDATAGPAGAITVGRRLAVVPKRGKTGALLVLVEPLVGKVESGTPVVVPVREPPAPCQ
jgi:hypothetical protein